MTDALANLMACILLSMLGAYFLAAQFNVEFWPGVAGCFYILVLSRAHKS